ncbi:MAG: hypothetical protein PHF60_03965 [Candidatus ainarchaeum sp.]|nr:hypothetical protein [Candidatus ainarchaeum sp.]
MGRSIFILGSEKRGADKVQVRKFRDEFRSKGLGVSGPFADSHDALAELTDHVKKDMSARGVSPIDATLSALVPRNAWGSGASSLQVPFVVTDSYSEDNIVRDCAGAIASSAPVMRDGTAFREISPVHLELLTVAVLRRLGMECFYAVMHPDHSSPITQIFDGLAARIGTGSVSPMSCVLVVGKNPEIYSMRVPFVSLPLVSAETLSIALEVLDDDATHSLLKLEVAVESCVTLMHEVATKQQSFDGEWSTRAIAIGHTIHAAKVLWTPEEISQGIVDASDLLSIPAPDGLSSIGDSSEGTVFHPLNCLPCHAKTALATMLPIVTIDAIKGMGGLPEGVQMLSEGAYVLPPDETHKLLEQSGFSEKFGTYMSLVETMGAHIHQMDECRSKSTLN